MNDEPKKLSYANDFGYPTCAEWGSMNPNLESKGKARNKDKVLC
uniref:Uncharacterized protein n=1 Tax=Rhizophora mucronata TaxID=61149 RepID=A0A2P2QDT2_RHIMU